MEPFLHAKLDSWCAKLSLLKTVHPADGLYLTRAHLIPELTFHLRVSAPTLPGIWDRPTKAIEELVQHYLALAEAPGFNTELCSLPVRLRGLGLGVCSALQREIYETSKVLNLQRLKELGLPLQGDFPTTIPTTPPCRQSDLVQKYYRTRAVETHKAWLDMTSEGDINDVTSGCDTEIVFVIKKRLYTKFITTRIF